MSKFLGARRGYMRKGLIDFCEYIKARYDIKNMNILEIGAYQGESAAVFAQYFKHVTSIEPWTVKECLNSSYNMSEVEAEFDKIAKQYGNISKVKGFSYNVVGQFQDKSFDVVYIDGCHFGEAVKKDIQDYLPKARLIISGHDYGSERNEYPDLIQAVNSLLGKPDKVFQDFSWIKELK